jgi:hypothetical protein
MVKKSFPPRIMYIESKGGGYEWDKFGNQRLASLSTTKRPNATTETIVL